MMLSTTPKTPASSMLPSRPGAAVDRRSALVHLADWRSLSVLGQPVACDDGVGVGALRRVSDGAARAMALLTRTPSTRAC